MIPDDKRFWFTIAAVLATWTAAASVSAGVPTEQIRSTCVDRAILVSCNIGG